MEELKLIFPTKEYKEKVMEYLEEHVECGEEKLNGVGGLDREKDFDRWLEKITKDLKQEQEDKNRVPSTQYIAVRKIDNEIVGFIQIRHELNDYLFQKGGHIGYGVRPSQRKKGYAKQMLKLALEESKKLGIEKVLMTCYKSNIASRRTILSNGGVLENEVVDENNIIQRFWITNK